MWLGYSYFPENLGHLGLPYDPTTRGLMPGIANPGTEISTNIVIVLIIEKFECHPKTK